MLNSQLEVQCSHGMVTYSYMHYLAFTVTLFACSASYYQHDTELHRSLIALTKQECPLLNPLSR